MFTDEEQLRKSGQNVANKRPLFIKNLPLLKGLQTFQVYTQSSLALSLVVENMHIKKTL